MAEMLPIEQVADLKRPPFSWQKTCAGQSAPVKTPSIHKYFIDSQPIKLQTDMPKIRNTYR